MHRPAPVTAVGGAGRRSTPSADPVCDAVGGGSTARTAGEPSVILGFPETWWNLDLDPSTRDGS
ncbi:hypothetical protein ABZS74_19440, partial [Streptomyces microflavus]